MHIDAQRAGERLTLRLNGRLDGTTAALLAQQALPDDVTTLVLDLDECPFVSSAGLREILRTQKRMTARQGRLRLDHVSREVQHILEMTGFSTIIDVRPKRREISVAGLVPLSAGVCGECFQLDAETVVKLYHEGVAPEVAEQEKAFAKAAFVLGIPTAISYDVVRCGTRTGIVYEMLDAQLFSAVIRDDVAHLDAHAATLAQVARTIHATTADAAVFPDLKARFRGYIDQMDFFLSAEEIADLHARLERIPDADTCVHFDLHSSNIMIRDGEPVIIDMGDFSRGSPLFDLGLVRTIYGVPELGISELATKIPAATGVALYERFLAHYFAGRPREERECFEANRDFLASLRLIYTITFLPKMREACARMIRDTLLPRMREEHAHPRSHA
jgi:uncharacterized protein (TIGR02172 family)